MSVWPVSEKDPLACFLINVKTYAGRFIKGLMSSRHI